MNKFQKEYIHRVNRVVDYIEAHMDEELNLKTLAGVANFSPYHFHRIFSAFTGETINGFVKRLRIEKAARLLIANEETPVSEIAYVAGFNNVSVFCRNFKAHFKMSALDFRENWETKNSKIGQSQSKINQYPPCKTNYVCAVELLNQSQMNMDIKVKEMPAMDVIYCRHIGEFDQIGPVYEKLMRWAASRGLVGPDTKGVTLYHDDPKVTEQFKNRQSACIVLKSPYKGEGEFGNLTIKEGKFAVGRFELSPEEFQSAWDSMCVWISRNAYQPADAAPYEIYHNDYRLHPEQKHIVDICIPVIPL